MDFHVIMVSRFSLQAKWAYEHSLKFEEYANFIMEMRLTITLFV